MTPSTQAAFLGLTRRTSADERAPGKLKGGQKVWFLFALGSGCSSKAQNSYTTSRSPSPAHPHTRCAAQAWPDSELISPSESLFAARKLTHGRHSYIKTLTMVISCFSCFLWETPSLPTSEEESTTWEGPTSAAVWAGPKYVWPSQTSGYPVHGKRQASV